MECRISLLISLRLVIIIIGFSGLFLVISSSLITNHDGNVLAKPGKGHGKNKKVNKPNDQRKDDQTQQKDNSEDHRATKQTINRNFDYEFADEGDMKREDFNFAVAGDFGCSKNTENTINNMKDKKPELVLPLGDLSYDKTATCWLDLISPFSDKLKVTLGYHDVNDGTSKLNQYEQTFGLKRHYDSFDYKHVHFVIMSSLSELDKGSDQYKFISEDLKKASENKDIDWIIVTSYSPFYTSPSKHTAEKDMRDIYYPLEQCGVDLVLQAHITIIRGHILYHTILLIVPNQQYQIN